MTDADPRIFRNLERTIGRDGFDTIVRAAVAGYSALRRPGETQCREFGRLVVPLFDKTDKETRRILAASLSTCPKLPRDLVERMLSEPVEVAAPFLLASPLLTVDDLVALAKRRDPALKKLLAARRGAEPASGEPPRRPKKPSRSKRPKPAVQAAPPADGRPASLTAVRQTELLSTGTTLAEDRRSEQDEDLGETQPLAPSFAGGLSADETREVLRRLASPGGRGPGAPSPRSGPADLVALALQRDAAAFYAALGRRLLLDGAQVAALASDETAEPLVVALKAARLAKADALTVLMMVKPRVGVDVAAFEAMSRFFDSLSFEDCAGRFDLDDRASAAPRVLAPQYAETSFARPEARPAFGRRKTAPLEHKDVRRTR